MIQYGRIASQSRTHPLQPTNTNTETNARTPVVSKVEEHQFVQAAEVGTRDLIFGCMQLKEVLAETKYVAQRCNLVAWSREYTCVWVHVCGCMYTVTRVCTYSNVRINACKHTRMHTLHAHVHAQIELATPPNLGCFIMYADK